MDNNNNLNGQSQSWTDPITGEVYPTGNPHVSLGKSVTANPNVQVQSFREPTPQVQPMQQPQPSQQYQQPQEFYPQGQPTVSAQQAPNMQVMQGQYVNMPQVVERPMAGYQMPNAVTKFCEHCGSVIAKEAVICPSCGCQVGAFQQVQQSPVIINTGNVVQGNGRPKDKLVALLLCLFLGEFGAHRFYEGKIGTAILYMFTWGLFGIGWLVDLIIICCKPKTYYVK